MKPRIVLDPSAAMTIVVQKKQSLITRLSDADIVFIAPNLFSTEVANAVLLYIKKDVMSMETGMERIQYMHKMVSSFVDMSGLYSQIMNNAITYNLSYYDAEYLTLAIYQKAELFTFDKKLAKVADQLKMTFIID